MYATVCSMIAPFFARFAKVTFPGAVLAACTFLAAAQAGSEAHAQAAKPPAPPAAKPADPGQCFRELTRDGGRDFVCEYPAWLTDKEREDLEKLTRGYLKDARCRVSVRIERARLAQAMIAPDLEFQAPPQPVVCDITTSSSTFAITGKFAPRVVFKGGEAVEGTPGLTDVEGVSKYLAWPVVQYVNRSPGIRAEMLKMINAYRAHVRARREARGG